MTDPTPTRAEVERYDPYTDEGNREGYGEMEKQSDGDWVSYADYQALRERAEAARRRGDILAEGWQIADEGRIEAEAALTEARRAESAAWNDAIEAEDKAAIERQGRRAMGDGHGNSCYDIGVSDAASAIRALRRAAPTEGEA